MEAESKLGMCSVSIGMYRVALKTASGTNCVPSSAGELMPPSDVPFQTNMRNRVLRDW